MNNITKTIKESLESYEEQFGGVYAGCDGCSASLKQAAEIKSHLLQSQIKLIEAVIEGMKPRQCQHESMAHCLEEQCYINEGDGYNQAITDQISSLTEVLNELKSN